MAVVDMSHIGEAFHSSLIGENDIDLGYYHTAYEELFILCSLLGTIFGFVASEILSKMIVLRELKNSDVDDHFSTMTSMIHYEKDYNFLRQLIMYLEAERC